MKADGKRATVDLEAYVMSRLREFFADEFGIAPVTLNAGTGIDGLGLDSLDRITVAVAIEDEFGVEVDDETLFEARTLGEIAKRVAEMVKSKRAEG